MRDRDSVGRSCFWRRHQPAQKPTGPDSIRTQPATPPAATRRHDRHVFGATVAQHTTPDGKEPGEKRPCATSRNAAIPAFA